MADVIQIPATSGQALYALVRNSIGYIWKTSESQFVAYVASELSYYQVVLGEQGVASGYYIGAFPATAAGTYHVAIYQRGGSDPAEGDTLVGYFRVDWTGSDVASVGQVQGRLPTSLVNGHISASTQELAGSVANAVADALLDRADAVETGYTTRKALRLILAALAGKLSGATGTTISIRNVTDSKTRIQATVDAVGNRTALTLDAS